MAIPSITNNSPTAGSIAWGAFNIQLYGVAYSIPAASTNQRWVWWKYNGGAPSINSGAEVPDTLTDDDLVLFANKNGIGVRVQSTSFVDGELLVDGSIFAAALSTNLINSQHIVTAGLDAGVIKFGEMSGQRISADTITALQIASDTITANEIAADTITANEIATDAITANEIAAGAVTALEIAANTITGDKIVADTIAVTKLIVSDLTNLAPDGDFFDATLATWDLGVGAYVTRVDPSGDVPYVILDTATSRHSYLHNKHTFEIDNGDEFFVTMEVSTPATNVDTLTLVPAVEVYNADLASQLWRVAPSVSLPPNTAWTTVQGVVSIEEDGLARARFNSYVTPSTTASQKVHIRRVVLRRRGGGELIIDGSITALQVNVDNLTAAVLNTGSIQSQLTMTGVLSIEGANMGWSAAEGLYLGDDIRIYGDERTNRIEGDLVTESISVQDGLSISGDADLNGTLVSSNGITTPTGRMLLGQTWPKVQSFMGDGKTDCSNIFHDMAEYDGTRWVTAMNFFGAGLRLINKSDLSWAGDLTLGSWKDEFYPIGGTAVLGSYIYMVGSDAKRNGSIYIYKVDRTGTINKVAEKYLTTLTGYDSKRLRLVTDGTEIALIYNQVAGADLRIRWFNANLVENASRARALVNDTGVVHVGGAYYGPTYAGGPVRLVVSQYTGDSNLIRFFTTDGVQLGSEAIPRASSATICGLVYDATQGRMISFDKYMNFYTYSKYINGGTLNTQYTLYDGDNAVYPAGTTINGVDKSGQASGFHETAPSPVTAFTLSKRAWPTITTPPAPDELVTDVTKVDKANRLGVYAAVGGTARFQSYLPVGERTLPLTDELSTSGALAGASGVPTFDTAMVPPSGRFRSAAELGGSPVWDLRGSGDGRVGPYRWDVNSRPLNHGNWMTANTASIAHATWAKRVGWFQRDSVNATTHGISYSNGDFTVSQSGLYFVSGALTFINGAVARRINAVYVNDVQVARSESYAGSANSQDGPTVSTVVYVPAGGTISLQGWQASGGPLAFTATEAQNYLSIVCLAAY